MSDKQFDDTNRGTLFRNDRKETDKHPDFTGSINVDGHDYWLSAWNKTSNDGSKKFLSMAVKLKDGQPRKDNAPAAKPAEGRRTSLKEDMDDFIPFAPEFR